MFAIEAENLKKVFDPPLFSKQPPAYALQGINLRVPQGQIYTLLGPNGSGKTTLVKILAGLMPPTEGRASVAGVSIRNQDELTKKIGLFFPGAKGLFGFMTGRENLHYFAVMQNILGESAEKRISELGDLFGLGSFMGRKVYSYSDGMLQRLRLARAMLHNPDVLLLDEPTVYLDPIAVREFHKILEGILAKNLKKTIILTTHQLEEAQTISDVLGFLFQGRLIWEKPADLFRRGEANLLNDYLKTAELNHSS